MKKRVLCLCLLFVFSICNFGVFAEKNDKIYTEIKCYKARLFVCDTENEKIILVNVAPVNNPNMLNQAPHLEYTALDVCKELIFGSKGQNLTLDVINGYLLDSMVTMLVGKNNYGYKILSIQFN